MHRDSRRLLILSAALIALSWSSPARTSEPGDATAELGPGQPGFQLHSPPSHAVQHARAIEVGEVYLFDGLVNHDVETTREVLADDAVRFELGIQSGFSGDGIAEGLADDQFLVISGISNLRWFVECSRQDVCHAFSVYDLDVNTFGPMPPVLIAERFKVVNGLIEEIEAIFLIPAFLGPDFPFEILCGSNCFPDGELGH